MPSPSDIRQARLQAHLTQARAAALLGVTRVTWARYEAGNRALSEATFKLWLHLAGLSRMRFKRRPGKP